MTRRPVLLGLLLVAAALVPASANAGVVAQRFPDSGTSFSAPTFITAPPGDAHRVFVVEQPGTIRIIKDGVLEGTPFLDISSEVQYTGGEQGLLSMAFAPDYATSGRFYVYYTSQDCGSGGGCDEHVSTFTATSADSGNPASEHVLLTIPHPNQTNHNGGQLEFGPDGDLYISVGDGGGANDTEQNAQHTDRLLGKLLRIAPGPTSYSIPAGNPFAGDPPCSTGPHLGTSCPEIWAYGLRNPWRFSFDSASGDLAIGDVGQDRVEEVDYAHPGQNVGANYGWPCYEGNELNAARPLAECSPLPSPVVSPVLTYPHSCSGVTFCGEGVIGGYVMHDPSLPSLDGCYVYGDLSTSRLRVTRLAQPSALGTADLGPHVSNLSTFGVDASGHLYAADIAGPVYRLQSDGNAATMPSCVAGPGGSGGPPPPPPDKVAPKVSLSLKKRQRILRTGSIRISVLVSEQSRVTATATVNVGHAARVLRFRRTARTVAPGKRVALTLRLSKATRAKLRKAFRHRRSFVARVTVSARDAAGNTGTRKRSVRLVR